jgi:hypothetical protein
VTSARGADGSVCASRVARDKLALHSSKALWSSGVQMMGLGALDSGSGENVMKWYLVDRRMGQKSHIEVQHAQETAKLTGDLGRVAVLKMDYLFFQRSGIRREGCRPVCRH